MWPEGASRRMRPVQSGTRLPAMLAPGIAVLLVEDDPTFIAAFTRAIERAADLRLIGAASTFAEGKALIERTAPDVLLVDLGLPDGSGIDLIRLARQRHPDCDAMVATVFGDEAHVIQSIEAGATGYLLPRDSIEPLSAAIIKLAQSEEQRIKFGTEGRRRFTDQFRHQTMTRRIREVYEAVLAGR